jgi:hypothetical protein
MGFNPDRNWEDDYFAARREVDKLARAIKVYRLRVSAAKTKLASLRGSTTDDKLAVQLAEIHYVLIGLPEEEK